MTLTSTNPPCKGSIGSDYDSAVNPTLIIRQAGPRHDTDMLLLRRLKRTFFMNGQFRRYTGCAVGEITLVIAGILIALRIDTGHE